MMYPNPMLTPNLPLSIYGNRPSFRREMKDDSASNEFRDEDGAYEESNSKQNKFVHLLRPKIPPSSLLQNADYLSLINDKDNFHNSGCSYHLFRQKCVDNFGLCKGGCKDFSISESVPVHDCRCIPYGYAALLKLAGR
ncbi:unnamed protein product [Auanema sp. JU1783]|nr:unnamed protein product [Auanema sp. JU1783]